jgi:hypothetical protein
MRSSSTSGAPSGGRSRPTVSKDAIREGPGAPGRGPGEELEHGPHEPELALKPAQEPVPVEIGPGGEEETQDVRPVGAVPLDDVALATGCAWPWIARSAPALSSASASR